jgi:hypothetical protein
MIFILIKSPFVKINVHVFDQPSINVNNIMDKHMQQIILIQLER